MTISTQQFIDVNIGAAPNDGNGDDLRTAFNTVNQNFSNIGLYGFSVKNVLVTGAIEVQGNLLVDSVYVPASNTAPGTTGQIAWTSGNLYICVAANTWVRTSLTSAF